jgi:KDO2-lipid IV(A) lauroyltransferase
MKLFTLRLAMRLFSRITPRAAETVAPVLSALLWYASPRKRRVTRLNLRAVYPELDEHEIGRIGRDAMAHYVRGVFEAGMLWHWPLDRIFACFEDPVGQQAVLEAFEGGKGLILAAPHCGAWELLNLFLTRYRMATVLYKPGRHPEIDEALLEKRRRCGAQMAPANAAGLRMMYKTLKGGEAVGLLPDQEPTRGEGQFAPFFGIETLTGVLLPRMARRTGAPVYFTVCARRPGGRYRVHFFRADDAILSVDMRTALTAVNHGVEQCIEVDAGQYLWAYKRFRNRPDGEPSFYKR